MVVSEVAKILIVARTSFQYSEELRKDKTDPHIQICENSLEPTFPEERSRQGLRSLPIVFSSVGKAEEICMKGIARTL